jgi:aldehyde dehydrogenase (NAD+)
MDLKPQSVSGITLLPTLVVESTAGRRVLTTTSSFARRNPALRDDVVTIAPVCERAEVVEACETARSAQRDWARVPAPERARVLFRLARLLADAKEELARFVTREIGKPIVEARGSVQEAIDTAEYFAGEGRRLHGQTVPSELREKELFTFRRPVGVVGVITSGNFPVAVPAWKLVPAVLCGNAVVWKPSEDAPGTAALLAELFARAGLPSGVLAVVHGGGEGSTGEHLVAQVESGLVDKIAFTGSSEVGRRIGAACGRALQQPLLELGGKNPVVVLADADLEQAVDGALWSAFATAGQRCTSAGNVIVDRRVMAVFKEQFVARVKELKIGDPSDARNDCGPLINERFLERWVQQRGQGLEDGAELLLDGRRIVAGDEPAGFSGDARRGLYAAPRVFDRVRAEMRIAREECFGPTVNLIEVSGLDEAISAANASPYALAAAIYTRDARAMLRFREESNAGLVSLNNATTGAECHLPFGGNGWSGNGAREGGQWALDSYTRWQAVNADYSGRLQKAQIDAPADAAYEPVDWAAFTRAP